LGGENCGHQQLQRVAKIQLTMRAWVYFRPGLDQLFHPLARSHARIILSDVDLASMVGTARCRRRGDASQRTGTCLAPKALCKLQPGASPQGFNRSMDAALKARFSVSIPVEIGIRGRTRR